VVAQQRNGFVERGKTPGGTGQHQPAFLRLLLFVCRVELSCAGRARPDEESRCRSSCSHPGHRTRRRQSEVLLRPSPATVAQAPAQPQASAQGVRDPSSPDQGYLTRKGAPTLTGMKRALFGALAVLLVATGWLAFSGFEELPPTAGGARCGAPATEHLAPVAGGKALAAVHLPTLYEALRLENRTEITRR
jgi:hypothetical protein